jgi:uncharacterized phage-associated protein
MYAMISFDYKPEKFAHAVAYVAGRKPNVTKKEICKLLFFADKEHLLRFGRPITGDTYHALEQGPVPSKGLDALNERGDQRNIDAVRRFGKISGWTFQLERVADLRVLSKSDRLILEETMRELGHLTAWQLEELSHKEPAWIKSQRNARMDFELFFEGRPETEPIKAILLEEQEPVIG